MVFHKLVKIILNNKFNKNNNMKQHKTTLSRSNKNKQAIKILIKNHNPYQPILNNNNSSKNNNH